MCLIWNSMKKIKFMNLLKMLKRIHVIRLIQIRFIHSLSLSFKEISGTAFTIAIVGQQSPQTALYRVF